MKESKQIPNISVRLDKETLHLARIEAVKANKTLGAWLKEAIKEKIERSEKG
jgi:hypothetical protein